jgi:hypothetical protein
MNVYNFPFWNVTDRVIGQPTNDLSLKYESTYRRVADLVVKNKITDLNLLGLFATNYLTIGDYLAFRSKVPLTVRHIAVIERSPEVCEKIKEKQEVNKNFPLTLIQTSLNNLTYKKTRGNSPLAFNQIKDFQSTFSKTFNVIDIDLMSNWTKPGELEYIPGLLKMYSAKTAVVHINAISNHGRTPEYVSSQEEVLDLFQQEIGQFISIEDLSIQSYWTKQINKTQMTSLVFSVNNE